MHLAVMPRLIMPAVKDAGHEGPSAVLGNLFRSTTDRQGLVGEERQYSVELRFKQRAHFFSIRPIRLCRGLRTFTKHGLPRRWKFASAGNGFNRQRVANPDRMSGVPEDVVGEARRSPR